MQTWKLKKKPMKKAGSPWGRRIVGVCMLVLTVLFAGYSFPTYWNRGARAAHLPAGFQMVEEPFRLGLDLQGGTHLVYGADMSQIPETDRLEALEGVKNVIERRVNAFGVSEPIVQTTSTGGTYRLIIELAGVRDVSDAINQIGKTPVLEFKTQGEQLERDLTPQEQTELDEAIAQDRANAKTLLTRARSGENFDALIEENGQTVEGAVLKNITKDGRFGELFSVLQKQGLYPGQVSWSTYDGPDGIWIYRLEEKAQVPEMLLSHTLVCFEGKLLCHNPIPEIEASLKIRELKEEATAENFAGLEGAEDLDWATPDAYVDAFALEAIATPVGQISDVVESDFGYHLIYKRDERQVPAYTIKRIVLPLADKFDIVPDASPWVNTSLSGKQLKSASVQFDQNSGEPNVLLNFNSEGADLFGDLTAANVQKQIAIFLDGAIISAPVVQQAIYGGQAQITGSFGLDEAKLLARDLNAGALPVPIHLLSQQTVGPTLGMISLQKSVAAALIGFALVALFMIGIYRLGGFTAALALVLFAFLNLGAYKFFGVTITLAGIAGFVLSLGIAVDANVLILERFKEEYASGRDVTSALDEAFARAWAAIRDGNLTTLIAAAVLYWFSSSFIRGFALTLSIGVLLSMLTAIIVTRVYLKNVTAWKWARRPSLFAVKKPNV